MDPRRPARRPAHPRRAHPLPGRPLVVARRDRGAGRHRRAGPVVADQAAAPAPPRRAAGGHRRRRGRPAAGRGPGDSPDRGERRRARRGPRPDPAARPPRPAVGPCRAPADPGHRPVDGPERVHGRAAGPRPRVGGAGRPPRRGPPAARQAPGGEGELTEDRRLRSRAASPRPPAP
ncbi:hypothetical protein SGPA1_31554 [Streptomyces misionensis JCM 4497]